MSQKLTPVGSRRNTTASQLSQDEFINLYNNPFNQTPSKPSSTQKVALNKSSNSIPPQQQQSSEKKSRSKSPVLKTFKELRNISPNKGSQDFSQLGINNRDKVDLNASIIMNKEFEKCDDYKDVLRKIFNFYATFGDRINRDALKANNLVKLVHDTGLMDKSTINQNNVNILFCKHSLKASTIDFDKFLLVVIDIAAMKYPDIPQKEAFFKVFSESFKPLYFSLYLETNLGEHDVIFQEPLEADTIMIIGEIVPIIMRLYRYVFPTESQNLDYKTAKAKSELLLPSFFKEFELSPFLINLNLGHSLFREVLNADKAYLKQTFTFPGILEKDQGIAFTLKRFLLYLARIAIIGFSSSWCQDQADKDHENFSQQDKLVLLMEKMEVSPGFARFRKFIATSYTGAPTLLPSKNTMRKLLLKRKFRKFENMNVSQHKIAEDGNSNYAGPSINNITEPQATRADTECVLEDLYLTNELIARKRGHANTRSISPNDRPQTQAQTLELLPNTKLAFENNKELLHDIFKAYCSYLCSKSDYTMKITNLVTLCRDACLLKDGNANDGRRSVTVADEDAKGEQGSFIEKTKTLGQTQLELHIRKLLTQGTAGGLRASRVNINKSFDRYLTTEDDNGDNPQNSARQKGVTFEVFLKTMEYVALCNYPDVDEESAVKCVIDRHLQKVLKGERLVTLGNDAKGQLKQLMEILRDPALMDMIALIKKKMHPFYREYCIQKEEYVEFEGFMTFYRFYGIFPQLVSRVKLVQMFHNLAALYPLLGQKKENNPQSKANTRPSYKKENSENKKGMIDENLFIESIIVCALEVDEDPSKNTLEKVLSLVGKMKESLAHLILKKKDSPFIILELTKKQKALMEILQYITSKGTDIPQIKGGVKRVKKFEDLFINNS